jgi:hypothetical protein
MEVNIWLAAATGMTARWFFFIFLTATVAAVWARGRNNPLKEEDWYIERD